MANGNSFITLEAVKKWYGTYHALRAINLTVSKGEKIVLCGPSRSGKSTLIRCINHLENIQSGKIAVHSIVLNDSAKAIGADGRAVNARVETR